MLNRIIALPQTSLASVLACLEAAGEATRLRLLALLAEAELTVSELVAILGQSQPRVSRHLKLLVDAGLANRHREGAWAFFLVAREGPQGALVQDILAKLDPLDPILLADRARLLDVRQARAEAAANYFARHAQSWDQIRALHVSELQVEQAILAAVGGSPVQGVLDIGTGTGRMLELLAPMAERAVGVDQSPAMLNLARARLEASGLRNTQLRQGDIYALPVEREGYDLIIVHQVLHYLDDPVRALREAARVLAPGGRLLVADFAPHEEESLRAQHAHRRLGFEREEIANALREIGLEVVFERALAPARREGEKLTVLIWMARDPRVRADALPIKTQEVA